MRAASGWGVGATRRITIEVSEEAASVLEADPARVQALADLAGSVPPEEVRRLASQRLIALLSDPSRPSMPEEELEAELAAWNAEGRS